MTRRAWALGPGAVGAVGAAPEVMLPGACNGIRPVGDVPGSLPWGTGFAGAGPPGPPMGVATAVAEAAGRLPGPPGAGGGAPGVAGCGGPVGGTGGPGG